MGATWYFGMVPEYIEDIILGWIGHIADAAPSDMRAVIYDIVQIRYGDVVQPLGENNEVPATDTDPAADDHGMGADRVPDAGDHTTSYESTTPPATPLDRTIFPDGTIYETEEPVVVPKPDHTEQVYDIVEEQVAVPRLGPGYQAYEIERHIHAMTNQHREDVGLAPLEHIIQLENIARSHSQDMAMRNYFSHNTPEGLDPTDRGTNAGYPCFKDYGSYYTTGLAENIAMTYMYSHYTVFGHSTTYAWLEDEEVLASDIVHMWMNSPGHRANMLEPSYDKLGVGVAFGDDYTVYATQNFC